MKVLFPIMFIFGASRYTQCSFRAGTHWNAVPVFWRPERRSGPFQFNAAGL